METRKITSIEPHPLNAQIYGDTSNQELEESIAKKGILSPLLVTKKDCLVSGVHTIISGHRRYYAAKKIGLQEIPVIISDMADPLDIEEALIEGNRQRVKTNEQVAREGQKLVEIESERAKKRMKDAGKNGLEGGRGHKKETPMVNLPQGLSENGLAREKAAEKLGVSGSNLERSIKIVAAIDDLTTSGQTQQAEQLRTTLNTKSVNAAYQVAKPIIAAKKPEPEKEKKSTESTFNFTNENIDWARWSWNPMTGCKHGCNYCYARDIAMRFTGHFNPEFHEDRLSAPHNTKTPKGREKEPGMNKVFVGSMTDLFGEWVTDEQIQKVLDVCERSQHWTYLFLTKNPKRYKAIKFPSNCWVGATADTQSRCDSAIQAFKEMQHKPTVRFLSCEPLLENLVFPPALQEWVDWVIIGAQSKTTQCPEFQPEFSWVVSLHNQCRSFGIPVYWKPNLVPTTPKEWPSGIA